MSGTEAAVGLLVLTALGCALMIGAVLERKLRRDKREWVSGHRRSHLRTAILDGDLEFVRVCAARAGYSRGAQADFCVALGEARPQMTAESLATLEAAVRQVDLPRRLGWQLRARNAVTRGQAALLLSHLRLPEAERGLPALLGDSDPPTR